MLVLCMAVVTSASALCSAPSLLFWYCKLTSRFPQGTGFCQTYEQFLACRALFGVAMGGLYGNAAATALEDLPAETRGMMSGVLQQGVSLNSRNPS